MKYEARSVGWAEIRDDRIVDLRNGRLINADFSGRKLDQFVSVGSRLESCRFQNSRIESGSFGAGREVSEYVECNFDGARIHFGPGGFARFERCSFKNVDISNWFCFTVEIVQCVFSGRMKKAFFNATVTNHDYRSIVHRDRNEFWGNDFSEMRLTDVAFRTGIDLSVQRFPVGPEYLYLADAPSSVRRARSQVIGWQDLQKRQSALTLIRTLESELEGGQQQLLLRPDEFLASTRQAGSELFDLLGKDAALPGN